jgi:hypothetical protein
MNLPASLKISTGAAVLLVMLICALFYLFSQASIFQYSVPRSVQGAKPMQSEMAEFNMQEAGVSLGTKSGRIQAQDLSYLLKAL